MSDENNNENPSASVAEATIPDVSDPNTMAASVAPVELEELVSSVTAPNSATGVNNLGRVMDVSVAVTARVGMVRKTISEVLDLLPGTVIDLERAAGEPIDLVIGDKLIAKGEIVVVDDHYGLRVTEVIQDAG
ncbi:MAG: FliM/FliN family flagellar motor switch protein [Planctomycetota bacterium]